MIADLGIRALFCAVRLDEAGLSEHAQIVRDLHTALEETRSRVPPARPTGMTACSRCHGRGHTKLATERSRVYEALRAADDGGTATVIAMILGLEGVNAPIRVHNVLKWLVKQGLAVRVRRLGKSVIYRAVVGAPDA